MNKALKYIPIIILVMLSSCGNRSNSLNESSDVKQEKKQIIKYKMLAASVFKSTTKECHIWTLEEIKTGDEVNIMRTELQLNPDKVIYLYSDSTLDVGHYYASYSNFFQGNPRQSFYGSNEEANNQLVEEQSVADLIFELNQPADLNDIEDVRKFLIKAEKAERKVARISNDELDRALLLFQKKYFNVARRVYFNSVRDKLWEKNIQVSMSGRDITFTGYMFVDNMVKKDTYLEVKNELTNLRFKTIGFKAFDGDDRTYWELDSKKDSEL
ncbi:hypothetical protein [Bacteroides neonati]|uniref:hypothetical protein n=1 Tax=Bacteroides neonati TaxID=1347393 RepID=UPI0004B00E74|nr:hypothetical protein [Bacteroides neonati]